MRGSVARHKPGYRCNGRRLA